MQITIPSLPTTNAILTTWHKHPDDIVFSDEIIAEVIANQELIKIYATIDGVIGESFFTQGDTVFAGDILCTIIETKHSNNIKTDDYAINYDVLNDFRELDELEQQLDSLTDKINTEQNTAPRNINHDDFDLAPDNIDTLVDIPKNEFFNNQTERTATLIRDTKTISIDEVSLDIPSFIFSETIVEELNTQAIADFRYKFATEFYKKNNIKLGFMGFIIKACALELKNFPIINTSIESDKITYYDYCDINIVSHNNNYIIQNAESMSLANIENCLANQETYSGTPTFTIMNNGSLRSLLSNTNLNINQNAILTIHKIVDRPVAINGRIVIRPMAYLTLSYNPEFIDRKTAVLFLRTIKRNLQDLTRLLLTI